MVVVATTLSGCNYNHIYKSKDFEYKSRPQAEAEIVKYIGQGGDVVIPSFFNGYIRYISANAFQNCANVSTVQIPDCIVNIGDYAFQNCTGLTSVTWGNFSIGKYAFQNCTALSACIIFDNTSLGDGAFSGCSGLHAAYFEGDAPSEYQMGKDVFAGTASDFTIYYNPDKEGWADGWNGYHAVPLPATTTPSTKPNLV